MSEQADLRLVNLIARGVPMAEAKRRLAKVLAPQPATAAKPPKPTTASNADKKPAAEDEGLL